MGPQIMLDMVMSMNFYLFLGVQPVLTRTNVFVNCGWHVTARKLMHLMHAQCVPIEAIAIANCNPCSQMSRNLCEYQRNMSVCVHSQNCLPRYSKPCLFHESFQRTSAGIGISGLGFGHAPRQSNPATTCMFG